LGKEESDLDCVDFFIPRFSSFNRAGDARPSPFQGASILRFTHMASTTITTNPQPLSTTSHSRQNHLNHARSFSSASVIYEDQDSPITRPNPSMSFSMSQGSQGSGLMMQPGGPFRQSDGYNGVNRRNSAPQIYSVRIFLPSIIIPANQCTGYILRSRRLRNGGQRYRSHAPAQG
jgi:hypothetical protein